MLKKSLLLLLVSFFCSHSFSNNLSLSQTLALSFESPIEFLHSHDTLFIRYNDGVITHQNLLPNGMYQDLDLTGYFKPFVRSIFGYTVELPQEIKKASVEQGKAFGVKQDNVLNKEMGHAELFAVYSEEYKQGNIFIIENNLIQKIQTLDMNEKKFIEVFESINVKKPKQ